MEPQSDSQLLHVTLAEAGLRRSPRLRSTGRLQRSGGGPPSLGSPSGSRLPMPLGSLRLADYIYNT